MNIGRLILREILHRKLPFALGVISVMTAVGCLAAELLLLRDHDRRTDEIVAAKQAETQKQLHDHDRRTEAIVAAKQAETQKRMDKLEDDYRKITKGMGFNLLILPKDQNLADLYADDFASRTLPESDAAKLVASKVVTINHVLPSLQQKVKWPEKERTILLMGVRGEILIQSKKQSPILDSVAPGSMVLGHELHRSLGLKAGDKTTLMGREFTVSKVHPERGNKDDITVWINLAQAQEMLDKKGLINAILALECGCAEDRLANIRAEIVKILPETQVIEFASQAVARAEARNRAAKEAADAVAGEVAGQAKLRTERLAAANSQLELEKTNRTELRRNREALASVLVPLVIAAAAIWIGFLTLANVRERTGEIGLLRALGVGTGKVLGLFLGKAVLMGLAGAVLGLAAGTVAAKLLGEADAGFQFDPMLPAWVLPTAALLAATAAWLPALLAARTDPAVILRDE